MKKRRLTLRRTLSLLLALVLLIGVLPQLTLPVYAGNSYFYTSADDIDFEVTYGDEHGVGEVVVTCPTCGETYNQDFDDNNAHDAAVDIINENFLDCRKCCVNCYDENHCYHCFGCFENGEVERCPECESPLCLDCHLPEYPCSLCGTCRLESDGYSLRGHAIPSIQSIDALCDECIADIDWCAGCGTNCVDIAGGFFPYDEMGVEWCPNCNLCHDCYENGTSVDFGHCENCNVCGMDEPVCESCQLCWDCNQGKTHCPECDDCFSDGVEWCRDDGEHCIHCCEANGWLCEQCGVCIEATGGELCEDCGLCLDCCAENSEDSGCTHLYCVMSSEFEDHLCPNCGECPADLECEYCGVCENCQQDYHCEHELCPDGPDFEEHVCDGCGYCYELDELCEFCRLCQDCREHCEHDLCPEDPEYDDHFCSQCGDCYDEDEFCEDCELCIYCCDDNTNLMGCTHGLCVESDEFQEHYCFEDCQCLEECEHAVCQHVDRASTWSKNESSHWHMCSDCGASVDCAAHIPGSPVVKIQPDNMAGKNGTAEIRCTVCEQLMETVSIPCIEIPKDGSPYIISEPKDYSGKFSTLLEDGESCWAVMKVYAGGEGTLSYQWHYMNGQPLAEDSHQIGTKTATLRLYVPNDACNVTRGFYCVVTNAKGSAKTRTAEVRANHQYLICKDKGADGHVSVCCGAGCTEEYGVVRPHHYGDWTVIKQPTATASGRMSRSCQDCGRTDSKELPPVDPAHVHNYNILKYTSESHWYACSCGLVRNESAHSFGAWEHVAVQTAQAEGLDQRTCTVCGYKESKILAKLTHEHDFSKLKNKNVGGYDWPNGCIEDNYHVRYCYRCTAKMREAHEYGNWHVFCYPYTDKHGAYHKGRIIRKCLDCGHSESVEFTDGKWPIFTSCIDPDRDEGRWAGPYDVGGTMIANPGEKVKVTIKAHEGYLFPDSIPSGVGPFGVNDVGPYDTFKVAGEYYDPANSQVKDWKYDAATQTLTFTMPDGPVGLLLFPEKCDHEGAETYNDWIRAGCTNNGEYVRRCKRCDGVKEIISYTAPTGHSWEWLWETDPGDCYNRSTYWAQCRICGEERLMRGDYHHKEGYYFDAVEPTCVKAGRTNTTVCPECLKSWRGDTIPALGHKWTAWKTVQEATPTQKEKQSRSCTRCGRTETRTGDYSGPDYRFKADKTKIHFDFTYGEKLEPVTVKYTSIGRNPVTEITSVGEVIGGVTKQEIDGLQMTVIPQPWILVQDWLDAEPEVLTACANNNWDEVAGSSVVVTANVRKTKENYTLTVEGGTAWIDGKDRRTARDTLSIPGGEKLHLVADDPMGTFVRWEIVEDASGYLKEIFEHYSNYSSPIEYKNEEMTVWMSANDVTLRALYEDSPGVYRLTLDYNGEGTKPAEWFTGSGGTVDFLPKAANYGYIFEGWWTAPEGGEHIDVGSMLTADTTLYAHWRAKKAQDLPALQYTNGSRPEALRFMEVAIDEMAEKSDELKQALQAGQVSYQWFCNGKMISGENGKRFDIPADWIDESIHTVVCFNGHQIVGKPVSIGSDIYGEDGGYVPVSGKYSLSAFYGSDHETVFRTLLDLDPDMASGGDHNYFDLDQDGTNDLRVYKDYASHYYAVVLPSSNLQGSYYYPVPEAIREAMRIRGKTYYSQIKFRFPEYEDNGTYVFPLYKDRMILDPTLWDTMDVIDQNDLIARVPGDGGKYYDLDGDGIWDFNEVRDLSANTYYWQANPSNSTIADGDGSYEFVLPEKYRSELNERGMSYYSKLLFIFSKEQADRGAYVLDLTGGEVTLSTSSVEARAILTTLQCLAKEAHNPIPEEGSIGAGEAVWSVREGGSKDFTWREDSSNMTHFAKYPETSFNGVACFRLNSDSGDYTGKVLNYGSVYYSTLYIKVGELDQGSRTFDLTGDEITVAEKSPEYRTLEALATSGDIGAVWISPDDDKDVDGWSGDGYDLDMDGIVDFKIPSEGGKLELCPETRIFGEFTVSVTENTLVENFYDPYGLHYNRTYYSELVFRFPELSKGSYTLDLTSEDAVLDNDEYLKQTLSKLIAPNADWSGPVSVDLDRDGAADLAVTSSGENTLFMALPSTNLTGKWIWTAPENIAQKTKTVTDLTGYYDSITFVIPRTEQFTAPLEKAIAAAAAIDLSKYTAESVAVLQKALAEAKDALANAETMNEVTEKAKALNDAIAGLKEKDGSQFRFDDVKDESKFYFDPVYWAYEANPQITNGVDAAHFGPDRGCTRGQVVTFLWRAAGCPAPTSTETAFTDVKPGAFYEKAVAWAVENQITNGMSPTSFAPDATCTRGQIVTFLWRFRGSPAPSGADTGFTDVDAKAFYTKAVAWAVENKITNGMSPTSFAPNSTCTRGQIVTFLYRAMQG